MESRVEPWNLHVKASLYLSGRSPECRIDQLLSNLQTPNKASPSLVVASGSAAFVPLPLLLLLLLSLACCGADADWHTARQLGTSIQSGRAESGGCAIRAPVRALCGRLSKRTSPDPDPDSLLTRAPHSRTHFGPERTTSAQNNDELRRKLDESWRASVQVTPLLAGGRQTKAMQG